MTEQKPMSASFSLQGGDNESNIKRVLSEMKQAAVNHHNYKKYAQNWESTRSIILSQVENEYSQYNDKVERYRELREAPRIKSSLENNLAPMELFSTVVEMTNHIRLILAWKIIESELSQTFVEKMVGCLAEVSSLEVEREVLKRMGEMVQSQSDMFSEALQSRMQTFDSKFLAFVSATQNENRIDRKETVNMLTNALITNSQIMEQALQSVAKILKQPQIAEVKWDETSLTKDLDGLTKKVRDEKSSQFDMIDTKEKPEDIIAVISKVNVDKVSETKQKTRDPVVEPKKTEMPEDNW